MIEQNESFILISNFLLTTGMIVSLILIWILLQKSKSLLSRRLLATIFLCFFFLFFQYYGYINVVTPIYALGFLFSDAIGLTVGPLLYIYIQSLYQKDKKIWKENRCHFLPLLIYFLVVTVPFFISICLGRDLFTYLNFISDHYYLLHLQAVYLLIYAVLSLRLVRNYRKVIKENYSNLIDKDLSWIRHFLSAIVFIMCVDFVMLFYELSSSQADLDLSYITIFVMVLSILYLGYYGSSQSQILLPAHLIERSGKSKNKTITHSLANASTNEVQQLKQSLEQILQEEKPYLNEELTLGALAKMLPTTDKKLSALLNHELNTNFYDLINHYRVEAVKAKMKDSNFEHYTLLAIAFECGFKSKTSFNRIFKKETGLSPSAYKKQLADTDTSLA